MVFGLVGLTLLYHKWTRQRRDLLKKFAHAHQKAERNLCLLLPPLSIHTDSLHSGLFNGCAVLHYVTPLRVNNPSLQLFFPCESGSEKQNKFKSSFTTKPHLWFLKIRKMNNFDPFRGVRRIQGLS